MGPGRGQTRRGGGGAGEYHQLGRWQLCPRMNGSWPGPRQLPTLLPWSEVDSIPGWGPKRVKEEEGKEAEIVEEKRRDLKGQRNGSEVGAERK